MLQPSRTKYRKSQRGRLKGVAGRGATVSFGSYGLKAMDRGFITARQIESARQAMTRSVKRGGKIWVRIFPSVPISKKGNEVPMGGGKGGVDHYAVKIKPGTIIFEMDGLDESIAKKAMRLASHKLPVTTKFVTRK
jgi:large subunit ribosomal protein L16